MALNADDFAPLRIAPFADAVKKFEDLLTQGKRAFLIGAGTSKCAGLPALAAALLVWRDHTPYNQDSDWVFASPFTNGKRPYWPESALQDHIKPAVAKAGIAKRVTWHTFRHSLASFLGQQGEGVKTVQELLRHATSRITIDTYQQGSTEAKRSALNRVAGILAAPGKSS